MAQEEFAQGDTVRLKSGGPLMTVEEAFDDAEGKPRVLCVWFDEKNKQVKATFPPATLQADDGVPVVA